MERIIERCAGLDVHRDTIAACVRVPGPDGTRHEEVPDRKTDVADAIWICELVEHGLVRPSFVPPPDIRQLRDLTRQGRAVIDATV